MTRPLLFDGTAVAAVIEASLARLRVERIHRGALLYVLIACERTDH